MLLKFAQTTKELSSEAAVLDVQKGQDIFALLNFPPPSWEFVFWIFFFILVLILGLTFKKNQIILLIFSTYIGLLLFYSFPGIGELGLTGEWFGETGPHPFMQAGIFFILTALFFVVFNRSIVSTAAAFSQSVILNLLLGALWLGFFLSIILTFVITDEGTISIGKVAESVFLGPFAQFSWILLSLLGVALIKNPTKKGKSIPRKLKNPSHKAPNRRFKITD